MPAATTRARRSARWCGEEAHHRADQAQQQCHRIDGRERPGALPALDEVDEQGENPPGIRRRDVARLVAERLAQEELRPRRPGGDEVDVRGGERADGGPGIVGAGQHLANAPLRVPHLVLEDDLIEVLLAGEVVEQRRLADADAGGDLGQARAVVPAVREEALRHAHDPGSCIRLGGRHARDSTERPDGGA